MRFIGPVVFFSVCAGILSVFSAIETPQARAATAGEIQAQIDRNSEAVKKLEAEIAEYQRQLDTLAKQKGTLQSAISTLTVNQKQLASQIAVTQEKIKSANLEIQRLSLSIGDKETTITADQEAIAKAVRDLAEMDRRPLITQLISSDTFSEAWQAAEEKIQFNRALGEDINELRTVRAELSDSRDKVSAAKANLVKLQNQLTLQKRSVDASKAAQQQLLNQTRNQEANYQQLIAQKVAAQKAFEQELINLQGQLNLIVNPSKLPKVGSGVLRWPFSDAYMAQCGRRKSVFGNLFCVTQYFGNTAFSTANPQIYNGGGHNAIDISAPVGTPVVAAAGGSVLGTGNTDAVRGCYSFGKWVMIAHGNGLSTLYSHLSSIDVSKGQTVSAGQVIGLSGMSGYATGPHLHFGVYATEGTQIMTLRQFRGATIGCADATMPVATLKAYLNPLSYL